jgi:hypothetical protein
LIFPSVQEAGVRFDFQNIFIHDKVMPLDCIEIWGRGGGGGSIHIKNRKASGKHNIVLINELIISVMNLHIHHVPTIKTVKREKTFH